MAQRHSPALQQGGCGTTNRTRTLSRVDRLPLAEAQWVYDRILERRQALIEISSELNSRLAVQNIRPVGQSSLSRWAILVQKGDISRPCIVNGDKTADDLLADFKLSEETHAAFKVFLNLFARDVRSTKEDAA